MAKLKHCKRKIVEDALARNQERKTGSKRKQRGNSSWESCSSAKRSKKITVLDYNTIRLSPSSYFLNGTMTDLILTCTARIPQTR